MAGFETIVRPVVFPNIRPATPQNVPPKDATGTEQVIRGNPASVASNSRSVHEAWSLSRNVETERRVDVMRIYQKDDQGNVNKDNFVDVEITNRMRRRGGLAPSNTGGTASQQYTNYYRRQPETDWIKLFDQDQIRQNIEAGL
jgi:hypothetical protein